MKREAIANDFNQAQAFLAEINTWPCKIIVTDDTKKRSLPANSVQHCFYKIISEYTGEDIKTVGNRMKRDFGLPIVLSGEYGAKVAWMLDCMGFEGRTDAQQVAMMELVPVTSLFTSKEHTIFRDNMIAFWGDNNVVLEYKQ